MAGFLHWLWANWLAVYPNLEASLLGAGVTILIHHWRFAKKWQALYGHVDDLHGKVEALHVEVATGQPSGRHAEPEPPR